MGAIKYHSAIDLVAVMINKVEKIKDQWNLGSTFFIDVQGGFDLFSQVKLVQQMIKPWIDEDSLCWKQ